MFTGGDGTIDNLTHLFFVVSKVADVAEPGILRCRHQSQ
jgi:hypothetical protein